MKERLVKGLLIFIGLYVLAVGVIGFYIVFPEYKLTRNRLERIFKVPLPNYTVIERYNEGFNNFLGNGSIYLTIRFKQKNITKLENSINNFIEQYERIENSYWETIEWIKKSDTTYQYIYRSECIYIDADFDTTTGILSMQYGVLCHSGNNKDIYIL